MASGLVRQNGVEVRADETDVSLAVYSEPS